MIKSITGKCVPHARGDGSTAADADAFIQGAPDAAAASGTDDKGLPKGKMRQIAVTIAPVLLRRVDETAARTGQARAAIISSTRRTRIPAGELGAVVIRFVTV